jgi:gamma-glutamyl:cysteine ligase YbdK (ATP-grasp superfamily)
VTLGLFEGLGVEIEYMIVDRRTAVVRPIADSILVGTDGSQLLEVPDGALRWSNELCLHVIELKTNGPAASLVGLAETFQDGVGRVNARLEPVGASLLPGGMHPFMDPAVDTKLWPHEQNEIYRAFDRIFGCRGHGWSNLQSVHLNLPFHGDEELGRLHAAIRLVLPFLPGLSAGSPFVDGKRFPSLDARLEFYRSNSSAIPSITGAVVPEAAFDEASYRSAILEPMYEAIAAQDPEGVLRDEWLNARGAIVRFDRSAIEIRVIDTQEAPIADLAVLRATVGVLRALVAERLADFETQKRVPTDRLASVLRDVIRDADAAVIEDTELLALVGLPPSPATCGAVWRHLVERCPPDGGVDDALKLILEEGPLARRMSRAVGPEPTHSDLVRLADSLMDGLRHGRMFVP